jgi:hypothetical protein
MLGFGITGPSLRQQSREIDRSQRLQISQGYYALSGRGGKALLCQYSAYGQKQNCRDWEYLMQGGKASRKRILHLALPLPFVKANCCNTH